MKIWKFWRAPTTLPFNIFAETSPTFPTYKYLQKGVQGFFILFRSWVLELFAKIKKDLVSIHSFFTLLLITQYLNKIKKNPTYPFVDITK